MEENSVEAIYRRAGRDLEFRVRLMTAPRAALSEYNLPEIVLKKFVLPNFSWVVEGRLAGSARPSHREAFEMLQEAGVTALISLSEDPLDPQLLAAYKLQAEHRPVVDFTAPTPAQLEQTVASINRLLEAGDVVSVHCGAGLGRTGTVLAAYLVSQGATAEQAIAAIRTLRPGSIETAEQEAAIKTYEQSIV